VILSKCVTKHSFYQDQCYQETRSQWANKDSSQEVEQLVASEAVTVVVSVVALEVVTAVVSVVVIEAASVEETEVVSAEETEVAQEVVSVADSVANEPVRNELKIKNNLIKNLLGVDQ
jgi:hypothetical protein